MARSEQGVGLRARERAEDGAGAEGLAGVPAERAELRERERRKGLEIERVAAGGEDHRAASS